MRPTETDAAGSKSLRAFYLVAYKSQHVFVQERITSLFTNILSRKRAHIDFAPGEQANIVAHFASCGFFYMNF